MHDVLRTFVALRVRGPAQARLHGFARALADEDRVLHVPHPEDLHLTLQFLGPTPTVEAHEIARGLRTAAAGIPPIPLAYVGLGAFPDARRARVLWAGVEDESPEGALAHLAARVAQALEPLGYRPERRGFRPHVTLARVRGQPGPATRAALARHGETAFGDQIVSDLKLIVSDPTSRPYRYIDLTTVELGDEPGSAP